MSPTEAAKLIQDIVVKSEIETAAQILANLKERRAAEILVEIPDKNLASNILEKMIGWKQRPQDDSGTKPGGAKTSNTKPEAK